MDIETLERAGERDRKAARTLREWLSDLSAEARRQLETLLETTTTRKGDREAFWKELVGLKDAIASAPRQAPDLDPYEARARLLGACETVQVIGLRSLRSLLLGDHDDAEELLAAAHAMAPECRLASPAAPHLNPCRLDLQRRSATLEAARGRPQEGLRLAQMTFDGYEELGTPGHDLDGNGIAAALYTRGVMRWELKDADAAAADFASCVDMYPASSKPWIRSRQNLGRALSATGEPGRRQAYELMAHQRLALRKDEGSADKAYFWWLNGQLKYELGPGGGRHHAMRKLRETLDDFATLGMPDPYAVLARDIAWIYYPDDARIHRFLREIWPTAKGLLRDPRQRELFQELAELTGRGSIDDPLTRMERLYQALVRLRDLVPCEVPCLISRSPGRHWAGRRGRRSFVARRFPAAPAGAGW